VIKEAYYRTYCISMRVPKGAFLDQILYGSGGTYIYVRKTAHPDPKYECLVTVERITRWDRRLRMDMEALPASRGVGPGALPLRRGYRGDYPLFVYVRVTPPDKVLQFRWTGQIIELNDYMAYIGRTQE